MPQFVFKYNEYDSNLTKDELVEQVMSVPETLYKYREWNDFTKDILINHRLFFAAPDQFNDLCDCVPYFPKEVIESSPYALLKRKDGQLVIEKGIVKVNMKKLIQHFCQSIRITCFSRTYRSILMWSHYANCHKGICLVFDRTRDERFFQKAGNVLYSPQHQGLDYHNLHYANAITVKFEDWYYEEEVRLPRMNDDFKDGNQLETFNPKSLVGIIFGAKCPEEVIKEVKELCQQYGLEHVKFSQMYMCPTREFKMEQKDM